MTPDDFFGKPPDPTKIMFWSSVGGVAIIILIKVLY